MPEKRQSGLFSSLLVPQESFEGLIPEGASDERTAALAYVRPFESKRESPNKLTPATAIEAQFRHGRWWADRERVRAALVAANVPAARLERFDACGAGCIVEYSPSLRKHRVRAMYCKDRFCVPCCEARSKKVIAEVLGWAKGERLRFLTLTQQAKEEPLQTSIDRLLKSFKKIRDHNFWKSAVAGGVAVLEIKRTKDGLRWHVHLHALLIGTWLDRSILVNAWEKVTDGSYIVDLRAVGDAERGVGYVAKYATKGWTREVVEDADALLECVISLRGRRLFLTFGCWHGREEPLCKVRCDDWKRIGRIDLVTIDAIGGQPYALAVFRSLGYGVANGPDGVVFCGARAPWSGP